MPTASGDLMEELIFAANIWSQEGPLPAELEGGWHVMWLAWPGEWSDLELFQHDFSLHLALSAGCLPGMLLL